MQKRQEQGKKGMNKMRKKYKLFKFNNAGDYFNVKWYNASIENQR